jgi:hypothetical protein
MAAAYSYRNGSTPREAAPSRLPYCAACRDKDPNVRYAHYLHSARVLGVDDTYEHVLEEVSERVSDPVRAKSYALDIQYWLSEQISTYEHVVDEYTGAFLPWWEGRQRTILAMAEATEAMKKRNLLAQQEREVRRYVRGFASVGEVEAQTPLREPGEEEAA